MGKYRGCSDSWRDQDVLFVFYTYTPVFRVSLALEKTNDQNKRSASGGSYISYIVLPTKCLSSTSLTPSPTGCSP